MSATCAGCGAAFKVSPEAARAARRGERRGLYCSVRCAGRAGGAVKGTRKGAAELGREVTGANKKQEQHPRACFYCIEAPDRKRYIFRNLVNFVRENSHLFPPEKVEWKSRTPGGTPTSCTASNGLGLLFALNRKYRAPGSWYDWKAVWKKDPLGRVIWERAPEVTE